MGKIALWILVAIVVMLVIRLIASNKRKTGADAGSAGATGSHHRQEKDDAQPRADRGELMMSCAVCEIHLPASDAIFARGKVFCSPEHRDLDEGRQEVR